MYHTKTLKTGNASIIIRKPVLSLAARREREDAIKAALELYSKNSQSVSK